MKSRVCACGCEQLVTSKSKTVRFIKGHNFRGRTHTEQVRQVISEMGRTRCLREKAAPRLCKCGCGEMVTSERRETLYLPGHNYRGCTHSDEVRKRISEKVQLSLTPEVREKLSQALKGRHSSNKGRTRTLEERTKIVEGMKSSPKMTAERAEALRQKAIGRKHSEDTKRRLSELMMGNQRSAGFVKTEETRAKLKEAWKYRSREISDATREKLRAAGKEQAERNKANGIGIFSAEAKAKATVTRKQRGCYTQKREISTETRRKLSEHGKNRTIPPEVRARMLEGRKRWNESEEGKLHTALHSGENHHNWKGGTSLDPYCCLWTNNYKEEIRARDGFICQNPECGKSQDELGRRLHVHHINYNKKDCHPANLISLCHNCHTKTMHVKTVDKFIAIYRNVMLSKYGWQWNVDCKNYTRCN